MISRRPAEECERLVGAMLKSMKYEQFYASGTCFVPEIGVYGGWVAHKGSFAARQSARTDSDATTLLFSGECFPNSSSTAQSVYPESKSIDREIDRLLRLYDEEGDLFVRQINGLFSGLLIDRKQKRALLFNDRYSIERIYFYEKDDAVFFASEAKALLRVVPELRAFDDDGVAQFLTFGCTLDYRTLFKNVRFLPGGSLWSFEGGISNRKGRYFFPENWESQGVLTEQAFETEFLETFRRILPRYASADLSIGISLTGGLDTRMIMAGIPKNMAKPVCYTFSGLTGETLDVRLAARVAQACGLDHHVLRIGADFLSNYGDYLDRTVLVTDGCAGALTAHEIYLNGQGRRLSPIRLTGNFGSEILRSMSTFKSIGLSGELTNADFNRMLSLLKRNVPGNAGNPVTCAAFRDIPWSLFGSLAAGRSQMTFRTPYLDNEIVALAFRAPPSSRQSPQSAMCVVNENKPALGKIPTDRGLKWDSARLEYFVRRLFSEVTFKLDYLDKEGLPHWLSPFDPLIGSLANFRLLGLHKFLPYRTWFRRELATYVSDVVATARTQQMPYWNSSFLKSMVSDHVRGRKNNIREIHALLTLEATERQLIRGFSDHPGQVAKCDA